MGRSTQAQMHERYDAILAFCEDQHPVTVRGIYYHLTTKALVPKHKRVIKKSRMLVKSYGLMVRCRGIT